MPEKTLIVDDEPANRATESMLEANNRVVCMRSVFSKRGVYVAVSSYSRW